jgi:hypothetical protein
MKLNFHIIVTIGCLVSSVASIAQSPVLLDALTRPAPAASLAVAGRINGRIPWSELGAKAGADYKGDGLAVTPDGDGARLHCAFQHLDGEATREGLWLTSTAINSLKDRFRVVATAVGRRPSMEADEVTSLKSHSESGNESEPCTGSPIVRTGTVLVEGKLVRFTRPGLVEEYSVSMDGVRQDFLVPERPAGGGDLAVRLAVSGARVEPSAGGAQLVLENCGRKIAYSRLRVTDATGKELTARMEVIGSDGESQRDSIAQPRVASPPATLGQARAQVTTLKGLHHAAHPDRDQKYDASPLGLEISSRSTPRVARRTRNPGLMDAIPSGLSASTAERQTKTQPEGRAPTLVMLVNDTDAVYPVRIDPTFSDANWISMGGVPGADNLVFAVVADGAGNVYIAGSFTAVGDSLANHIAKWNGNSWSALGSGMSGAMNARVSALAVSGNNLYAGGQFTDAGGIAATNIAQWNGSSWSALDSGLMGPDDYPFYGGAVSALVVSGSNVYAGGTFTTAGGIPATNIAKWNGSSWSSLGSGISGNNNLFFGSVAVHALAVSGNSVYVGGYFTIAGGTAATNIAKWDGNTWSTLGSGMNYYDHVYALAASGSNVYAAGTFTKAGGIPSANIARWNGSSWSALGSGISGGELRSLAISGSNVYAGGYFTTAGGIPANYIAKWDGSSWSALGSGVSGSLGPYSSGVFALAVSGTDLYAGGPFSVAGQSTASGIAKWSGSSWSALGSGMDDTLVVLAPSGNDLYVGGGFTKLFSGTNPISANYIAKWNGSSWTALGSGMNGVVRSLAVSGSNVYAGGAFTNAGGIAANFIAKWNGSSWSALGSGMNSDVIALAVSGSYLYAGGGFTRAGGSTVNYVAKWNGSSWSSVSTGMSGVPFGNAPTVFALAASGGDVYAGGFFGTAGDIPAANIAKWDGSSWSALGSGMDNIVYALAVSGSDLYAGGAFFSAGGIAAGYVAKWDGGSWSALDSGIPGDFSYSGGAVSALAVSGSDLYVGGASVSSGNNLAKWDGSSWSPLGSGVNNSVNALAVAGNDLYVGGGFSTAGGKVSQYIARAYLLTLPTLALNSSIPQGEITVSWPSADTTEFMLQQTSAPSTPASWASNTVSITDDGITKSVTLPATNSAQFFRLRRP